MKQVLLHLDDKDHKKLKTEKDKSELTWERFILNRCVEVRK